MTWTPSVTATATIDTCNQASFIGDITIPDETILHISEAFTKTWQIQNVGTCTWTTAYKIIFISGEQMGSPNFVYLPSSVSPGQIVSISLNLVAPDAAGKYQGSWQLQAPNGKIFGVGNSATQTFWVRIRVITPSINTATATSIIPTITPTPTVQVPIAYDFVASACSAQWANAFGALPCPGLDGDSRGFVLILNQARLEDGTFMNLPTLLTFPASANQGIVQGIYPGYQVQAGDHLQAKADCEYGSTACSALLRISYLDSSGVKQDLWAVGEFYDGIHSNLDLDLSGLAGTKVQFVFSVSALGSTLGDRVLWVAPRIVHLPVTLSTPAGTATPSSSPPTATLAPTLTAVPTAKPLPKPTATPSPAAGNPTPLSTLIDFVNQIIAFFQKLLGH